jgi:hypothetical protein
MHRVRIDVSSEYRAKDNPDGDHDERDHEVVLERSGPRCFAAPLSHDECQDSQYQQKQDRVGSPTHSRGKSQGPDPPGNWVQTTREYLTSSEALTGVHFCLLSALLFVFVATLQTLRRHPSRRSRSHLLRRVPPTPLMVWAALVMLRH